MEEMAVNKARELRSKSLWLMMILVGVFTFVNNYSYVFADVEWGTGGSSSGGIVGGAELDGLIDYRDCIRDIRRCPRWIKVDRATYDILRSDQARWVGWYELPECASDDYVIIAGSQKKDGSLIMLNELGSEFYPYKTTHIYVGEANAIDSVSNYNCYTYLGYYDDNRCRNNPPSVPDLENFFSQHAPKTGKTYSQVLEEVIKKSGKTEKQISAFCESMVVDEDEFNGRATVSHGNDSKTTGYVGENKTAETLRISDCDFNGCRVNFNLDLKWVRGDTDARYYYTATKNGSQSERSDDQTRKKVGEEIRVLNNKEVTLRPGEEVCYNLHFSKDGSNNGENFIIASACAQASARNVVWETLLDMKVKNNTLGTDFQREVYAKPGDELIYQATYKPEAQKTYNTTMQAVSVICNNKTVGPYNSSGSNVGSLFNNNKNNCDINLRDWNNAFNIVAQNFSANVPEFYQYNNGEGGEQKPSNTHKTTDGDVGKELKETAWINAIDKTKTTPSQVRLTGENGLTVATVNTAAISSEATARVPYNFMNSTQMVEPTEEKDKIVYAGETKKVGYSVTIGPKINTLTSPNKAYATNARIKSQLEVCYDDGGGRKCDWTKESNFREIRVPDMWEGVTNSAGTITVNIPDVAAGSRVCVKSRVYPSSSGSDNNWNNREGSGEWTSSSNEVCFKVAKKPSLQVWGGNIYSGGNITTAVSIKNNLTGYTPYQVSGNTGKVYVFGSWGELGIIAGGKVKQLASGAGSGYAAIDNGVLWPGYNSSDGNGNNVNIDGRSPGGVNSDDFCVRSTLSFANSMCGKDKGNNVGLIGTDVASNTVSKDKNSIKDKFGFGGDVNVGVNESINLNDSSKINSSNVYYYYGKESFKINAGTINHSTIQIIQSDKNINISGNLTYENVRYETLERDITAVGKFIPKLAIMAKNINIDCGVNRIDALLIADEKVNTCGDSDDLKAKKNSNQLKINGAVIANQLIANRTYGAATGANSIIPAEIINFDPSLYLWGSLGSKNEENGSGGFSDADGSGGRVYLDVVYAQELAPRY